MQTYRVAARLPFTSLILDKAPMACYALPRHTRAMSTLSRFSITDFAPFFNTLDMSLNTAFVSAAPRPLRTWQPRFDVREEQTAFQLQGELAGLQPADVSIEFTDKNTMIIRGRTIREHADGMKSQLVAAHEPKKPAETDAEEIASDASTSRTYQKPTVEDEDFIEVTKESPAVTLTGTTSEDIQGASGKKNRKERSVQPKYWINERSVGEFLRSFTFPGHVDQDGVSAALRNGILSITVPKAAAPEPRKVTVL